MEIERKYLVKTLPQNLPDYPFSRIEQAYLCTEPVLRIRRQDNDYIFTYKSKGFLKREEYNLPLTQESYQHLREKADGMILSKTRYRIPYDADLTIELDVFDAPYEGLILAEIEFATETEALRFSPPDWFGEDVTFSAEYQNNTLSRPH